MEQFCKDVIDFLHSEYGDGYKFKLIAHQEIGGILYIELKIRINNWYTKTIGKSSMDYIRILYHRKTFIDEIKQYEWQKELIDIIEGS